MLLRSCITLVVGLIIYSIFSVLKRKEAASVIINSKGFKVVSNEYKIFSIVSMIGLGITGLGIILTLTSSFVTVPAGCRGCK